MQISSFMSSHKCLELSKRFSNNIPKTVDEMLKRVDDYLRSEEAFLRYSFRIRQVESSGEGCKAKRERGQRNNGSQKGKVINMVQCHDRKRKTTMTYEKWMNVPITFSSVLARDLSEEALVVEGEIEGYLVWRIHVDEGASVEIMREGKKQAVERPKETELREKMVEEDEEKPPSTWTRKGRKCFLITQKDDPGPAGPYNSTSEGNFVHIPGGIKRSSQYSIAGGKERKAISDTYLED
ncbi:hypothetical protein Tco_1522225 [Tanacetum coccineum]